MDQNTPQDQNAQDAGNTGQAPWGAGGAGVTPAGGNAAGGAGVTTATATDDSKFKIPPTVLKKYPDLVEMIKKTESMSDEERDYWFQILPIMTDEQVGRLRKILEEEAEQLAKLDAQYQDELSKLNKKHLSEWDEFEKKKEREERQEQEASAEAEETATEEALLEELESTDGNTPAA